MIEKLRESYSVNEICTALEISRSGYYAWKQCGHGERMSANKQLSEAISQIHEHRFMCAYGSPRMTRELKQRGLDCSENRVAGLMRKNGIRAKARKPYRPRTTRRDPAARASPNVLAQAPPPQYPAEQVVSDITYVPTREGWLYLTIIMDLFSRAIMGWDLSESLAAESLGRTLYKSFACPWRSPKSLFHSDRGSQYTSHQIRRILSQVGWTQSMSAKGYCYDNAFAESFFASFKNECLPPGGVFQTKQHAKRAIFDYIESFYNRHRFHSGIGYISPLQFLELYINKQNINMN